MSVRCRRREYLTTVAVSASLVGCLGSGGDGGTGTSPTESTPTPTERSSAETTTETVAPPDQPKITAVTDNFGHTYRFDYEPPNDEVDKVTETDELVVDDDTVVELCVTEVAKRPGDEVTYSFRFRNDLDHPDNPGLDTSHTEPCWRFDMGRADVEERWRFDVVVRNGDDTYYQNSASKSDYRVGIVYADVTAAG